MCTINIDVAFSAKWFALRFVQREKDSVEVRKRGRNGELKQHHIEKHSKGEELSFHKLLI